MPDRAAGAAHDAEEEFLGLPAVVGTQCEQAWRTFVSEPTRSRELAQQAAAEGSGPGRGWGALCLAYHQIRGGEGAAADAALEQAREQLRDPDDPRGLNLVAILRAYQRVARGEPQRAVAELEAALEIVTRSPFPRALDRFIACHALALAHGRLGLIDQVLHHHRANLVLLEQQGARAPLAVVLLNLSSALTAIDDWEEALELAQRAVECCAGMSNDALRRRAEINVALALRFLGRLDEALALLARLRAEPFRDPGSDFALFINSAEALAQRADAAAGHWLARARACAAPSGDAHERANLAWIDGLIAVRAGDLEEALPKLEIAKRDATALLKLHVPLLPRIVQELAECYARTGDHARAFETFRQFHVAYEARLGYITRARYNSRQSREGAMAIATTLEREPSKPGAAAAASGERARLDEALRRTVAAAASATRSLAGWSAISIARIGSEAQQLGVGADRIGGVVRELRSAADVAKLEEGAQPVQVRVLGGFEVRLFGEPLTFGRKRPERPLALLKYLAAHGVHDVAEAQAADALWPDLDGDAALRTLAVNLHRLRQLLGGIETVAHHGRRLALGARYVFCDAALFEGLLDRAAASRDANERERLTSQAISLYGGDLVIDEDRERWAMPARTRLRSRFLLACAGQGARFAAAGRWEEARASYACGLEVDPLAEELCLGVLRTAEALHLPHVGIAAYRRREAELAALGEERPVAAIEALYRELAEHSR